MCSPRHLSAAGAGQSSGERTGPPAAERWRRFTAEDGGAPPVKAVFNKKGDRRLVPPAAAHHGGSWPPVLLRGSCDVLGFAAGVLFRATRSSRDARVWLPELRGISAGSRRSPASRLPVFECLVKREGECDEHGAPV